MGENSDRELDIKYRAGHADDWPYIEPIVAATWDGDDYINEALWSRWTDDHNGLLVVAEVEDEPVGLAKISHLGPAEWWLEGLRVAPEMQRRGIARGLTTYLIHWFEKYGDGMLRLSTYSENEASAKVVTAYGMRHTASYRQMFAPARVADYRSFKLLQPRNISLIDRYLRRSPMYRANRFVEVEWKLYYLTHDRLEQYLESEDVQVLGWRQAGELQGLAIIFLDSPDERRDYDGNTLRVGALYAPDDTTLRAMLRALRGLAAFRQQEGVSWKMPVGVGLERVVQAAEYEPVWEDDAALWLFERPLRV